MTKVSYHYKIDWDCISVCSQIEVDGTKHRAYGDYREKVLGYELKDFIDNKAIELFAKLVRRLREM